MKLRMRLARGLLAFSLFAGMSYQDEWLFGDFVTCEQFDRGFGLFGTGGCGSSGAKSRHPGGYVFSVDVFGRGPAAAGKAGAIPLSFYDHPVCGSDGDGRHAGSPLDEFARLRLHSKDRCIYIKW